MERFIRTDEYNRLRPEDVAALRSEPVGMPRISPAYQRKAARIRAFTKLVPEPPDTFDPDYGF